MSHRLLINPGTPQAWEIQLKPGVNRIGRGEQNDFQIPHGSISSVHCEIVVSDAGVLLKDLGSTNGTFLNRAPVKEITLQSGQHLQLGAVDMIFESDPPTASSAPSASAPAPVRLTVTLPAKSAPSPGPVRLVATPVAAAPAAPPLPPPVTARPAGLRLSGSQHAAAPAAPAAAVQEESAEAPPPMASTPLAAGAQFCKFHAKTPARFYCAQCQKFFCDLCVGTRAAPSGSVRTCRACSSTVTPVQVNIQRAETGEKGFYASLPGTLLYPFRGFGIATLLLAAALFGGDEYLARIGFLRGPFGWLIRTIVFGFLFLYLQNIIHTTTADEKEPLGFPDATEFFGAAFELGMTVLISFSIAIVLFIARIFFEAEIPGAAMVAALIIGCLYFPMAFLAVAMKDSVLAANPLVVVPAILKMPLEYLVTTILLMGVFGLRKLGEVLSAEATGVALSTRNTSEFVIALGAQAVLAVASVYFLTVSVRILGLLYNRKKQQFGWFAH